ncbi:MAG: hypothetical protein H6684_05625 [Deltaproteobacteria bacterium]|nr:hypothetical protein [bacterium]MCB9477931.1 hypothetical protein [Deltaproteobacteria bacterium]MCB9488190.1 hypothetical protein [Deltaproteobacteria bacterium]
MTIRVLKLLGIFGVAAVLALGGAACDGGDDENADLAPEIFQDSLRVNPNPAWLNEDATFYFAWKDFDGDMEEPVVTVRFENEDGDERFVEINDVVAEGDTGGSIRFDVEVRDGDEGTYSIIVADEEGNVSNEIEIFLFVNSEPREDEDGEDLGIYLR